jgi:cellobiose-specific phosphotransferase system component IIC
LGVAAWWLYRRGWTRAGIVASYAYAAMNLLVLGHYLVAPPWRLPPLINLFILVEAAAATLLLAYTVRLQVDELVERGARTA